MTFQEAQIAAKRLAGDNVDICLTLNVWLGPMKRTDYSEAAFYSPIGCEGGYGDSWDSAIAELTRKWNARTVTASVESADVAEMEAAMEERTAGNE